MTLHLSRLLLEVRYGGTEIRPAEMAEAARGAIIDADGNDRFITEPVASIRVAPLDAANAMGVAMLADIDAYLAKQPKEEPTGSEADGLDSDGMAEHGGWEVAQAIRNILNKHRYDAYVATCRRFGQTGVSFEEWRDIQEATAGDAAACPSRTVG